MATQSAAKEALEYIENEERLDRNRAVSKRLIYRVVGPADVDKVHGLLYCSYYPDEPITKHLGICQGPRSIPDADRLVENILDKNLSLLAEDSLTGEPVGVAVNNSCQISDLESDFLEEELQSIKDPKYKILRAIHHELRKKNSYLYDELGTGKLFSMGRVGVSIKGQGIATDLIRRSVLLAGSLGYTGIKAEPTSKSARRTFRLVDMAPGVKDSTIKYADFEYEGERVLEGIPDEEITYLKKKFFQSALKHII